MFLSRERLVGTSPRRRGTGRMSADFFSRFLFLFMVVVVVVVVVVIVTTVIIIATSILTDGLRGEDRGRGRVSVRHMQWYGCICKCRGKGYSCRGKGGCGEDSSRGFSIARFGSSGFEGSRRTRLLV